MGEVGAEERAIEPDVELIDTHSHIWGERPGIPAYSIDDYAEDVRSSGHNVVASLMVEAHYGYRESGPEHLRCVGETETLSTFIAHTEPSYPDIGRGIVAGADLLLGAKLGVVLEAHAVAAKGRLRGVRGSTFYSVLPFLGWLSPAERVGMLRLPEVAAAVAEVAKRGLVVDLFVIGDQLLDVAHLAEACPNAVIVLNHLGGTQIGDVSPNESQPSFAVWLHGLRTLSDLPNVFCKAGGLGMQSDRPLDDLSSAVISSTDLSDRWRPFAEAAFDLFGAQRCMWESNFPVDRKTSSLGVSINAWKRLTASFDSESREAFFAGTAKRVYSLY